MKGLGDMKYLLLSQMYNTGRNTPAWNLNEWWAEKHRMRLKEENRISHERTFFNYEEGCLGLPGRNLCKSWFFRPGRMAAAYQVCSPDSVSQVRRHKKELRRGKRLFRASWKGQRWSPQSEAALASCGVLHTCWNSTIWTERAATSKGREGLFPILLSQIYKHQKTDQESSSLQHPENIRERGGAQGASLDILQSLTSLVMLGYLTGQGQQPRRWNRPFPSPDSQA